MASNDRPTEVAIPMDDGNNHDGTLAALKSKLFESTTSSSPSPKLKCSRVPRKLLADMQAHQQFHSPKLISFGPYHHGKDNLKRGETIKLKLAADYIRRVVGGDPQANLDAIYNKILHCVDGLKAWYDEEVKNSFTNDKFTAVMLVDGCALLWYIICVRLGHRHEDYDIRYQDLRFLHRDALLLENQLPYQLLQQLMTFGPLTSDFWTVIFHEYFFGEDLFFQELFAINEQQFLQKMMNYCCQLFPVNRILKEPNPEEESKAKNKEMMEETPCHHLLDLYRINFVGDDERSSTTRGSGEEDGTSIGDLKEQLKASFRNVKELMADGIRIKPSHTRYLRNISFTSYGIIAYLRLPPITIDKSTKTLFFNLIAYEMSSDVPNHFISYLRFLDSLVDHADDVKELQSAGVLQNNLGTHEEVAKFFNTVSAKLDSNFCAYKDVRVKIRKHVKSHRNSKLKIWMTQCLDTYFGSPWTIIAWIGAALALFLTAVQTYFSAFSR